MSGRIATKIMDFFRWNDDKKKKFDDYEWQNQLQNMVLEENPLEYLAKFLKGK